MERGSGYRIDRRDYETPPNCVSAAHDFGPLSTKSLYTHLTSIDSVLQRGFCRSVMRNRRRFSADPQVIIAVSDGGRSLRAPWRGLDHAIDEVRHKENRPDLKCGYFRAVPALPYSPVMGCHRPRRAVHSRVTGVGGRPGSPNRLVACRWSAQPESAEAVRVVGFHARPWRPARAHRAVFATASHRLRTPGPGAHPEFRGSGLLCIIHGVWP